MVGTSLRTSILDHIYIKDPTILCDLGSIDPFFGDHVLVEFKVAHKSCESEIVTCRDWRNYSKELLYEMLRNIDWEVDIDNVQEFWNVFENKLIKVVDKLVPLTSFVGTTVKSNVPKNIKNKINKRNRLLRSFKRSPTVDLKAKI